MRDEESFKGFRNGRVAEGSGSLWASGRVALVTGGARRVGRVVSAALHARGYSLVIHCASSAREAAALAAHLNSVRADSACVVGADLSVGVARAAERLVAESVGRWGRLDLLVNNAALYQPTPLEGATDLQWDSLMNLNVKAPYFLIQAARPHLQKVRGCVVNVADILGERPSGPPFTIYSTSKAALIMATKSLAVELAPEVRVNYVNPGAAMWPDDADDAFKEAWIAKTPLGRAGTGQEVAEAVLFLASPAAAYTTGTGLTTCGGRSLTL